MRKTSEFLILMPAPNLVSALLFWYDANGRDLPWRGHPDPYAVLISEIMLQQTTVPAVIPRFEQWIKDFPTIEILASEEPETVLLKWEGLGYYSRARNLHAAAGEIVSGYGGRIPEDPVLLKKLPGIGEYTAAAVASIAYRVRAAALDANNLRVWSRLLAASDRKRIVRVFSRVIPRDRPGDFNQALMDLGSMVCTPKNPDCPACPLNKWCRAFLSGRVSQFPEKRMRPATKQIEAAIAIILKDREVLVQKRPKGGLMADLWEFPGGKIKKSGKWKVEGGREKLSELPEEAVVREVREETGLRVQVCENLGVFDHSYTRFRVKLHVFVCKRKTGRLHNPSARWVTLKELEGLAMPSVNRRIVKKLEERLATECDD